MRRERGSPRPGRWRRPATLLLSLALACELSLLLACAGRDPGPGPVLEPRDVATHASEFFCARGRWPADVAELEAFPMPAAPRTRLEAPAATIPWALLRDATLEPASDGALRVSAELPPGRVAGQPPERPVALRLRVEPPGCWPPRIAGSPRTPVS